MFADVAVLTPPCPSASIKQEQHTSHTQGDKEQKPQSRAGNRILMEKNKVVAGVEEGW